MEEVEKYGTVIVTDLGKKYDEDIIKNLKYLKLDKNQIMDKSLIEIVRPNHISIIYEQDENEMPDEKLIIYKTKLTRVSKKAMYE